MSESRKDESTAVVRQEPTKSRLPADLQARVDENRARNMAIAAIRGTVWGKDLNETQIRALAQYCRENGLDAVRHVEILGGRVYLTAELYDEKGAPLLRAGILQLEEPDIISIDSRLRDLAATGDVWAVNEELRRLRERIRWGVPDAATGACVQRIRISATGKCVVGVNWCGGGTRKKHTREGLKDADPIGDLEPVKTAMTRARRRAWRQIAEVVPNYAAEIRPLEAHAELAAVRIVEAADQPPAGAALPAHGTDGAALQLVHGYEGAELPAERIEVQPDERAVYDEELALDREIVDQEAATERAEG